MTVNHFTTVHEMFAHSLLADEILRLKWQTVPATSNTRPLVGRAIWHPSRGGCIPGEREREGDKEVIRATRRARRDDGEIQRGRR